MANALTTQLIIDGPRNAVIKIVGVLDTSDLASTVFADPAVLTGIDNTGFLKAATFRIVGLTYSIQDGLTVNLYWDATAPVIIDSLNGRGNIPISMEAFGGLTNNAAAAGKTGRIMGSTLGWVGVKSFTILLQLVKVQSGLTASVLGTPDTSRQFADNADTIPLVG